MFSFNINMAISFVFLAKYIYPYMFIFLGSFMLPFDNIRSIQGSVQI